MVTVAIRALQLEYLVKILDGGRSRSRYIFTDSDSTQNSFRLRLHIPDDYGCAMSCAFLLTVGRVQCSRFEILTVVRLNTELLGCGTMSK
jgi:hypothetical protein